MILKCSCCGFERQRRPCAEQLKVLGRMPLVQDFSLIYTTAYNHCYLKPGFEDVMKKMKEVLAAYVGGPLFGEDWDKLWPIV